ncbi:hypothetical protein [Mucilaginibacter aquaedulcis]|uniref:hypothetical protein n=1 Tax=Mucilaginibacter aquaedulcis TaxID=1187081 RepID=UPI0025B38752|nr:hypothetical protein [Mucilaginibacter aquaedulcis]MDN3551581.1 hypothetical protein [Mucilaginibacter aquaedulcis]
MKTTEKNANGVQGATAKGNQTVNRTENRPSLTGKEAKPNENPKDQTPAENAQADKNGQAGVNTNSPIPAKATSFTTGHGIVEPKLEPTETGEMNTSKEKAAPAKTEEIKHEAKKNSLSLEQTLKSVEGLHRLSIQRITLLSRIKLLEDFEVKLIEGNDELEYNPYQGCKLIIKDDKGREFFTNTPNLIRLVAQFIFDACHEKLAEIEGNIIFPNA